MKVGIDIHGVLDHHPEKFIEFARQIKHLGCYYPSENMVYIVTGLSREKALKELQVFADQYAYGIPFWDEVYSIVDYVKENNIPHHYTEDGHLWTNNKDDWDAVKGMISRKLKLDLHFDDSPEYEEYFEPGVFCLVKREK